MVKKIPCLFVRQFEGKRIVGITSQIASGCEWALAGEGHSTVKWDGTACMVRDGKLFKRFDARRKAPPPGFESCGEPDPVTGHNPGWLPVGDGPDDRWHREAVADGLPRDGTYELIGPAVRSTTLAPYPHLSRHTLRRHGMDLIAVPLSFDGLREFLRDFANEGIVFHHPDGRMAKIRRDDFGFPWPPLPEKQTAPTGGSNG